MCGAGVARAKAPRPRAALENTALEAADPLIRLTLRKAITARVVASSKRPVMAIA